MQDALKAEEDWLRRRICCNKRVASKKIGNAVVRNRAKRLLRAAFYNQQNSIDSGIFILIAKKQMNDMSFSELERNLKWALKKIGAVK